MIKLKHLLIEKRVRLSTMKDAIFEPGQFVQILGKKGKVKLDKKSVKYLAKWIRSNSGKHGMGWSFTEGKLNEFDAKMQKNHFLNLIKKEVDSLKGQIAYAKDKVNYRGTPDWEKKEFKGVLKDLLKKLKDTEKHYKRVQKLKEEKLTEGKTLTLPNGVKVEIDFKGVTFKTRLSKPVFLDRDELLKFFRGSTKYLRYT